MKNYLSLVFAQSGSPERRVFLVETSRDDGPARRRAAARDEREQRRDMELERRPQRPENPDRARRLRPGRLQLYARTGETVVVPFENQNMYVLKFGQTSGETYYITENGAPTLYIERNGYLENASAQGAKWYPFSKDFVYERPAYIGIAPSWTDYMAMGWYSGMLYHGGYWGYRPWYPGFGYSPMVGLNINIGGRGYGWNDYRSYSRTNVTNRYTMRSNYNYNSVGRRAPSTFGRSSGSAFGRSSGSSGSFGRSSSGRVRQLPARRGVARGVLAPAPAGSVALPGAVREASEVPARRAGSGAARVRRVRSGRSSSSFGRSSSGSFGRSSGGFGRRR